jgi:hypothetical protein
MRRTLLTFALAVLAVLIDVSGTYLDQKREAVNVIKREILPQMVPGDTLIVIRVDSESYDEENVEALLTLDRRPSHANAQKLAMAQTLDEFAERGGGSKHTDIPGAIMLASEYLSEVESDSCVMLIFSDMQEDLPPGSKRALAEDELQGTHVAAMNVKRLQPDTVDPAVFRDRLSAWERRVKGAGASEWRTFMDATKLPVYLAEVR